MYLAENKPATEQTVEVVKPPANPVAIRETIIQQMTAVKSGQFGSVGI